MFCPQCAAQNSDGVKFCRKCGMELEAVALVLSELSAQPVEVSGKRSEAKTAQEWLEKRSTAVRNISTGVSLLVVSVLIGVAMAFFVPSNIPWILAWAVLVGWMAMWGGIEVGNASPFRFKNTGNTGGARVRGPLLTRRPSNCHLRARH